MYLLQMLLFLLTLYCSLTGTRVSAQPAAIIGPGCTTATMIDWDCDGYGPGSPLGPDADDNDPAVNTAASFNAKYPTLKAGLAHLGYDIQRVWQISLTGNDHACGANGPACATFVNGVSSHLRAGDAVVYRAGTYAMPAYSLGAAVSGSASHPIVFMAYPGEKVILDWTASNGDGPNLSGQSYITFDGLILKGGYSGMGISEIQYGSVSNVVVRNMQIIGFYTQIFMVPRDNFLYERNVFGPSSAGGEHNMYLMGNPTPSSNLIVRNNLIFSNGAGGGLNIHLNGRFPNAYVGGNIMYNAQNDCLGLQTGVNHSMFENNVCFTTANSAFTLLDYYQNSNGDIVAHDENYNTFRNNTVYYTGTNYTDGSKSCTNYLMWVVDQSGGRGSLSNPTSVSHDMGHNTYDNNVMVSACPGGSTAAIRYDTDFNGKGGMQWLATDTWRNNIIYSANPYQQAFLIVSNYSQNTFARYSLAQFEEGLAAGKGTNRQADPLLVAANPAWYNSPQQFNLQVRPGSPAIGAGVSSDAPATDVRGKPRGGAPDIGAYQFEGGASASPFSVSCVPGGQPTGVLATCTITLSGAAPAGGATVALASDSMSVTAPESVVAPAGATSVSFAVTGKGDSAPSGVAITARLNGVSRTISVPLLPRRGGER